MKKKPTKPAAPSVAGKPSNKQRKKDEEASPFAALRDVKAKLVKEEAARAAAKGQKPAAAATTPSRASASPSSSYKSSTVADPDEDRLSFHRLMNGVMPLDAKKGRVGHKETPRSDQLARPNAEEMAREAAREAEEVRARLTALVDGKRSFETRDDGRRAEGRRIDLAEDVLRKLRRGHFPIDARLDLHGLGVTEAHQAVATFLGTTRARGERCVLVVHGKGEHSPRGTGILRGEIATWVSQGPASEHVAAFATAANDDGGEGAMYVLLRR